MVLQILICRDAGDARGCAWGTFPGKKVPHTPQNPNNYFIQIKTVYLTTPCRTCIVPLLSCCEFFQTAIIKGFYYSSRLQIPFKFRFASVGEVLAPPAW